MAQLKKIPELIANIRDTCVSILVWKDENDPDGLIWEPSGISLKYEIPDESFSFDDGYVQFYMYETWTYGGSECHHYKVAYTELISEEWKEKFLHALQEKKMENLKMI